MWTLTSNARSVCQSTGRDYGGFTCVEIPDITHVIPQPPVNLVPAPFLPPPPPPLPPNLPDLPSLPPNIAHPPIQAPKPELALPNEDDVLRRAMPGFDAKGARANIKTLEEMSAWQLKIAQNMSQINSEFYRQVSEDLAKKDLSFDQVSKFQLPAPDQSSLSLFVPKSPSNGDLKGLVDQALGPRGPLNWDKGPDNDIMTGFLKRVEGVERAAFDSYMRDQNQITQQLFKENLSTMVKSLGSANFKELANQKVEVHGEFARSESENDLNNEILETRGPLVGAKRPTTPKLQPIYDRIVSSRATSPQARTAQALGLGAVTAADDAYRRGDNETGDTLGKFAAALADIGVGFIPVVGEARDIYEVLTGKNLLTGELLTDVERGLALAGVISFGVVSGASRIMKAAKKLGANADELSRAAKEAKTILKQVDEMGVERTSALKTLRRSVGWNGTRTAKEVLNDINESIILRTKAMGIKLTNVKLGMADDLNRAARERFGADHSASYLVGSRYIAGLVDYEHTLVRVFSSEKDNLVGGWLVDPRVIEGLSPMEIKGVLNLSYIPDRIVPVIVPRGTAVHISIAEKTASDHIAGAIQVEVENFKLLRFGEPQNL
ncbi:MAG: pre-toxin TG domain-containing protein [Bdellovibrionales bacterium]